MAEIERADKREPINLRRAVLQLGGIGFVAVTFGVGINYLTNGVEPNLRSEFPKPGLGTLNSEGLETTEAFIALNDRGSSIIEDAFVSRVLSVGGVVGDLKDASLCTIGSNEEKGPVMQMRLHMGPEEKRLLLRQILNGELNVQEFLFQLRPPIGEPAVVAKMQGYINILNENGVYERKFVTVIADFDPDDLPKMNDQDTADGSFSVAYKINAIFEQVKNGTFKPNTTPIGFIVAGAEAANVSNNIRNGKYIEQVVTELPQSDIPAIAIKKEKGKYVGNKSHLPAGTKVGIEHIFINSEGGVFAVVRTFNSIVERYTVLLDNIQTVLGPEQLSPQDSAALENKRQDEAAKALAGNEQNDEQLIIQPGSFEDSNMHETLIEPPVYEKETITQVGAVEGDPSTTTPSLLFMIAVLAIPAYVALAEAARQDKKLREEKRKAAWDDASKQS